MYKYFIVANSFAAPFCSDQSTGFQTAENPKEALEKFAKGYGHRFGLYAAMCYESAEAYHEGKEPVGQWLCNFEQEKERVTKNLGAYTFCHKAEGVFTVDDKEYHVVNPRKGSVTFAKVQGRNKGSRKIAME